MGRRESAYSGFDLGRASMVCYDGEGPSGSAMPVVDRLMGGVRRGGAIGSPGTLRGNPSSLESVSAKRGPEEEQWVRERAREQTVSGVIYVHEESMWVRAHRRSKREL